MKRIRPATVTMGVLAILFGLIAAYTVRQYLRQPEENGVEVVVARYNLPRYARLQEPNLDVIKLPPQRVPEDAVRHIGQAIGRLVKDTTIAGKIVTQSALYGIDEEPVMAEQLPPGLRAVTISVNQQSALDGVLLPESLVDVALTAGGGDRSGGQPVTVTVVRGVRVLATSQHRHRFSERSQRELRSITVAATPQQANKLILAQRYGELSVTLRSALENELPETQLSGDVRPIRGDELLGLPPRRTFKAQIWRGTSMSEITFQPARVDESRQATFTVEDSHPLVPASFAPKEEAAAKADKSL